MADDISGLEFQSAVYRSYEALHLASSAFVASHAIETAALDSSKGMLAGEFIVADSLHGDAATLPLAALIAGACFLGMDSDAEAARQLLRAGQCDFVVNALDEALRILKNELRQKKPVAVGLTGDVPAILAEMVDRGVAPDVLLHAPDTPWSAKVQVSLKQLAQTGTQLQSAPQPSSVEALTSWSLPEGNPAMLAKVDAVALTILPADDRTRRRWLEAAPRFLPRHRPPGRVCALSSAETERFLDAIAGRVMSSEIFGPVIVTTPQQSVTLGATYLR